MKRRQFIGLGALASAGMLVASEKMFEKTFASGKDWKVFIFNASHSDMGWHDLPEAIRKRIAGYVDTAVDLCNRTKDAPDKINYVITLEHSWIVDYYQKHRSADQFKALLECIRRGQMDVGAFYTSVHTDLCGHEELARLSFFAAQLRKRYNLPISYAMLNDVSEGYTMGMPQLMAKNGIEGVVFGPGVKVVWKGIYPRVPRIFYWQTVDGSKVMVAWTPGLWTYQKSSEAGMKGQKTLDEFSALTDYPYDAIFRHGGGGDIQPPDAKLIEEVKKFREECHSQNIQLATMEDFFSYIKKNFNDKIPVVKGDNPQSWADGTNSLALETGLHKRNQHHIITAEALATIASAEDYPGNKIQEVYNNLHLYSDHTWGYDFDPDGRPGQIRKAKRATTFDGDINLEVPAGEQLTCSSPFFDSYKKHWQAKKDYVYKAKQITDEITADSFGQICKKITVSKPSVVVWNPLSFKRTDIVRVPWNSASLPSEIIDLRDLKKVACQLETDDKNQNALVFTASEMPPMGYSVFEIPAEQNLNNSTGKVDDFVIENEFYKVKIDEKTGTILSVFDKEIKKEMVDIGAGYSLNQYIHNDVNAGFIGSGGAEKAGVTYGEGTRYTPDVVESISCFKGPVYSCFESKVRLTQGPAPATIKHIVKVYHEIKKIEVVNYVEKKESLFKEQIYIAFPFDVGCNPKLQVELPYAMMQWDKDILPGCWRGYSSVQNFVRLSGSDSCVTWSSPETPVATFGGINSNHYDPDWHKAYVPRNAQIYSYAMSNMWNCNYVLFQGGKFVFPYSFITRKNMSLAESASFGWATAHPLIASVIQPQKGSAPAKSWSALSVDRGNVLVSTLKKAEDGQGYIIRLYETNQEPLTVAVLTLNFFKPKKAYTCMISEENMVEIPVVGNVIKVNLKPNELVSIRIV
jgi:alpha-mannosidase